MLGEYKSEQISSTRDEHFGETLILIWSCKLKLYLDYYWKHKAQSDDHLLTTKEAESWEEWNGDDVESKMKREIENRGGGG